MMADLKEARAMEHICRYLISEKGKAYLCWQKGKRISKAECTRCLLAYIVNGLYSDPKNKKRVEVRR